MSEVVIALLLVLAGGTLLIVGGEILVRGASRAALMMGIPPLIVGLTIVAACTSAPELTVSLMGCFQEGGTPEIAIGNVVGSNICNILLILGITAIVCPIVISSKLIKKEIPILTGISILFWILALISERRELGIHYFPQWGGALFLIILVIYTWWTIHETRRDENKRLAEDIAKRRMQPVAEGASGSNIIERRTPFYYFREGLLSAVLIASGLGLLLLGSDWFIKGAVSIATYLGVSTFVISLTVLAVGTSLPELVVSIVAAFKGKTDIAIGNVIGSNIFNLLGILGLTSLLVRGGLELTKQAFIYDIPVMILVALIGSILCITDRKLTRWEGVILLVGYVGYVGFLVLR